MTSLRQNRKYLFLCHGDKNELEGITNQEYRYIRMVGELSCTYSNLAQPIPDRRCSNYFRKNRGETIVDLSISARGDNEGKALSNLYSHAKFVGADALIHYKIQYDKDGVILTGVPVKKTN